MYKNTPLACSILFGILCVYFGCVLQVYTEIWAKHEFSIYPNKYNMTLQDRNGVNTLPDTGFNLLPFIHDSRLADFWVITLVTITVIRFIRTQLWGTILRRWLFCMGILMGLRGLSLSATLLPQPDKSCITKLDITKPFYSALLILTLQRKTCADVLFSGHSVNGTLCALIWSTYADVVPVTSCEPVYYLSYQLTNRCSIQKVLIWFVAIFGYLIIISTHFHYTVDVLFGVCLTWLVWSLYHYYLFNVIARIKAHLHDDPTALNDISRPVRMILWFESYAMDVDYAKYIENKHPAQGFFFASNKVESPRHQVQYDDEEVLLLETGDKNPTYQSFQDLARY